MRRAAADHSGGTPGQYALTDSTTMGIATMYGGLALSADDEVLSTTHDFFSTEDSLRLLTKRTGAKVKRVTLYDQPWQATVDEMVSRLVAGLTPRTKVVAVTWVHSSTGVRLPDQGDRRRRSTAGPLLCVDGVHGFAAVDVDLPDLGCDFLSAGTHKWLFGPRGTGILWGRDWGPLTELIPSFSGPDEGARLSPRAATTPSSTAGPSTRRFAFHQKVGRAAAVQRTVEQATQLKEGLAGREGHPRGDAGATRRSRPGSCASTSRACRRATACTSSVSRASWRARRRTRSRTSASAPASSPRPSRSMRRSRRSPDWSDRLGSWPPAPTTTPPTLATTRS